VTIALHGVDGLLLATMLSGVILLAIGLLRLGTFIKYIPFPVTVGFTAGIALIIFASQLTELLGLTLAGKEPNMVWLLGLKTDVRPVILSPLYSLLIMGHGRRQVLWFGVTAEWIAIAQAFGWEQISRS
jgi:MFS superfamily sulfate permease-like transporter